MVFACVGIGLAVCLSLALTPAIRTLSIRKGFLDPPAQRKVHSSPIPRLGGIAVFLGVLAPLILLLPLDRSTQGFLVGLAILAILGIVDDVRHLSAWTKLPVQTLAAWMLVVFGGTKILYLSVPFVDTWVVPEWFGNIFTVLCVIALVNAMNLIDGLDGLAAGIATIIFGAVAVLSLITDNHVSLIVSMTFAGATLGFLKYNWHPASIFMGDTGSMILGFGLAFACLTVTFGQTHTMSTWVPFGLVAMPIFDTVWSFSRRIFAGRSPFSPDKTHIHHQLLRAGLPHGKVVLILYGLTFLLCLQTVLLAYEKGHTLAVLTVVTLALFWGLVRWLLLPSVHAHRLRVGGRRV